MNCCSYESTCYPGEGQQGRQRGLEVQQRLIVHVQISHRLRAAGGRELTVFSLETMADTEQQGWRRDAPRDVSASTVWSENPSGLNEKKERNRRRRQRRKWQARWFTDEQWLATISGDVSVFSRITVACGVAHTVRFICCLGMFDLCICEMYSYLFWGHCCLNCMVGTSRSSCSPACPLLRAAFSWGLHEMQTLRNYHPYQQVIQGSGLTLAIAGSYQMIFVSQLFNSFSQ